jgi:hypothetical protein
MARRLFQVRIVQGNYSEPEDDDKWYWQRSAALGNGRTFYPNGDKVGVVEIYNPAATAAAPTNPVHDRIALRAIAAAPNDDLLRLSNKSPRYVGNAVRKALRVASVPMPQRDYGAMVDRLIDSLMARGLIIEETFRDRNRRWPKGLKVTSKGQELLDGEVEIGGDGGGNR